MEANDEDGDDNEVVHELYLDDSVQYSNINIKKEKFDDHQTKTELCKSVSNPDVPSTSRGVTSNDKVAELFLDDLPSFKINIKQEVLGHESAAESLPNRDVSSTNQVFDRVNAFPLGVETKIKEEPDIKEEPPHVSSEKSGSDLGEIGDENEENEEDKGKNAAKKFQVDRSAIPEIAKSEQASELQGLEGLSVYKQETLEAEILKQVDNALTGGNQTDEIDHGPGVGVGVDGAEVSFPLLDMGRSGETEMERSIRLGEMTPFGTTLLDQKSKRTEPKEKGDLNDVIQGLEKYFRNQEKLTRKQNNRKREARKEKSVSPQKKPKLSQDKNPLDRKVLNRDGLKKKPRKKEKLGTQTAKDDGESPGPVCGEENYFHQDDTESEYVPSSEEEFFSSDDNKNHVKSKSLPRTSTKRNTRKYKLPGGKLPEDWRSDDSDWESSDEEYKRKLKHSKKELDDGDIDLFRHRIIEWEKENGKSADDVINMDSDQYHEFDSGFKIPLELWDKLYNYQRVGVRWMWELDRQCCGGILGDEMGLGKTIQMIAFLAGLHCSQMKDRDTGYRGLGPSIIVCPTTVMHQWVKEFHKWFPFLRVAVLHDSGTYTGKNKEDMVQKLYRSQRGILILSYTGAVHFKEMLTTRRWHYVILDEGHKIRNPDAQVTLVLKQLTTSHRLLLTGSPMQNNLKELWSLFDFIFPGKLGTLPVFMAEFAVPITQGGYANASEVQVVTAYKCATVLRDTISPFLLRRMKADVKAGVNLPDKNEQVLFCRLSDEQRALYKSYVGSDEVERILRGHMQIFLGLIALRKICNHPDLYSGGPKLFQGESEDKLPETERYGHWSRSGKMIVVETLLKLWKKQNHRVLLFTQGTQMLCILEAFVKSCGYKYLKLDGSTSISARQPLIDKFNQDTSYFVMVLTTRVGGLGVNLTGANRVVIFDPDWNPATDTQARERAWRIGQTQPVTIYRLITAGTIEEKMYHRQIFKQFLSNKVLKDPRQRRFFKSNDLFELFTLKETETEGSTETSAIFAGTGSEVKLDPNKRYRSAKKEIKPREEAENPSLTFSKKKIEHMKKLAQQLSMKLGGMSSKPQAQEASSTDVNNSLNPVNNVDESTNVNSTLSTVGSSNVNESTDVNSKVPDVDVNVEESLKENETSSKFEEDIENKNVHSNVSVKKEKCAVKIDTTKEDLSEMESSCSSVKAIVIKKEKMEEASTSKENDDNQSLKRKHRKHKKHKKHKRFKDVEFEGETVPHLVQHQTSSGSKPEDEESRNLASQDEYVLKKLFDKSGLQTAMKHDSIMEGGPSDYAIVECEAEKVAKEAVEALKKSRRECWAASSGVPTFTGQNGAIRSRFAPKKVARPGSVSTSSAAANSALTMSSADLIKRIRERNLMKLPEDSDIRLLNDIREFILANGGTALTDQLINKFQARLPAGKSPVFKSLLAKISVFYRAPDKKGYWTLRDEFSW
ncbi:LOW QUALITY PROTEIN: DNA excision repair protein ERCC-6 [Nilaparvata lugens]|uniref:LOW QUALITY PROTEIN: DNA excision repair protein ERCC-6 n=1 Tax=Nilaparvata lugens TaxID=108931 RepID=UPI00193E60FC|nr:LOW QUALITY PROTEIN: DNA excision repair protein ERCC-6 [Nilaparvata lugens]